MGTKTHLDDLTAMVEMISPLDDSRSGEFLIDVVGVCEDVPDVRFLNCCRYPASDYSRFVTWLTENASLWSAGLAPLLPGGINEWKSDLKFLDYTALDLAGIYSDVSAYSGSVIHNTTGLLTDWNSESWCQAIVAFLDHPVERKRMAGNAKKYLLEHRTLKATADQYAAVVLGDDLQVDGPLLEIEARL